MMELLFSSEVYLSKLLQALIECDLIAYFIFHFEKYDRLVTPKFKKKEKICPSLETLNRLKLKIGSVSGEMDLHKFLESSDTQI